MRDFPHREIKVLPPTPENIEHALWRCAGVVQGAWIEADSRKKRQRHVQKLHRLKDGRYFVLRYLGHWRQFVTGVKVIYKDGVPDVWLGVVLGPTEQRKAK